jgi:eukaryotic-like serine/threonine-protein kinase
VLLVGGTVATLNMGGGSAPSSGLEAVKVLSAELSRDGDFRARFVREADVAASLLHPNIVSIYRRGETENGQLWIAMQFVDGTDAEDALRAGTMTPDRAVFIVGEVAKALDHAHRHNIVHRDVKPANFLLSSEGGVERVLLGDFGIARALDDVGLTMTGSVLATVPYAAPEVLAGMPIDGRADLYSLGCSLFRLITGRMPAAMRMACRQ